MHSFIWYAVRQEWIYSFLSWHNRWAPAYYCGAIALSLAVFFVMYGIALLRNRLFHCQVHTDETQALLIDPYGALLKWSA